VLNLAEAEPEAIDGEPTPEPPQKPSDIAEEREAGRPREAKKRGG